MEGYAMSAFEGETVGLFPIHYLYKHEKERGDKVYLRQPIDGQYHKFTWAQTMDQARRVANFLKQQGLLPGDRVASLSKNCAEWFIMDFAIMLAEMISVPLYATQSAQDIAYILKHSGCKLIFLGKLDKYDSQENAIPSDIKKVAFPYKNSMKTDYQWSDIIANTPPLTENHDPNPDDLLTIIYTSGTTGTPKGVSISYSVATAYTKTVHEDIVEIQLPDEHHLISYLPLAHVVERFAIEFFSIDQKAEVSFVETLDTFIDNLRATSPTIFFAVPRIWSVFQSHILEKLPQNRLSLLLKIPFISSIVKKKIKSGLGLTRSVYNISGAAAIPRELLEWYHSLDIRIYEGYGQTEGCLYATINKPKNIKTGTVGQHRLNVDIKIAENKEMLLKTPCLMTGYYLDPALTAKVITEDGYFHTGDMAEIDPQGFVKIVGRVNDQFKTSKGEFVSPTPIERLFTENPHISLCCLVGLGIKQPILIAQIRDADKSDSKQEIETSLKSDLHRINKHLSKFEKVSHIYITNDEWTTENGLMTSTLKLRRNKINEKYHGKPPQELGIEI
jgi:long-chain acyl-CoA synthetase